MNLPPYKGGPLHEPGPKEDTLEHRLLKYFRYDHLPDHLQTISKPFCELAHEIASMEGDGAEITTSLRKLLEAKDCAVRAML